LRLLESAPLSNSLVVLNYHRVIDPADCFYDRAVISATPEQFHEQVSYLRSRFPILSLPGLIDHLEGARRLRGSHLMITFDDGYLDNYRHAFPLLRAAGVPAVFFPPTSYIGTKTVPWWDQIANLLRRSRSRTIRLDYPEEHVFQLDDTTLEETIRQVLKLFKSPAVRDTERFLGTLERECAVERERTADPPLFIDWDQAREMAANGMSIGSHTHSHNILSKLSARAQAEELRVSREMLERELDASVTALAIPVGGRDCFNSDTEAALRETGYQAAFSFYDGVNRMDALKRFDIRRTGVERDMAFSRVRFKAAAGASVGRVW
jgi:peptidoglycan/xylan/chitin deacetylase (PgdA/CDA1 family)